VLATFARLVVSLATVLLLMFALARYLNHRQGGVRMPSGRRRPKAPVLEVVTRQGLSRTASIAVVRVSGQLLLLGVTDSAVSVLREVDEPDEEPDGEASAPPAPGGSVTTLRPFGRDVTGAVVEALREKTVRRG